MPVSVSTAHLETTGGRVWDASTELLAFLLKNLPSTPLIILELGSGCGLLGLSLAEQRPDCTVVLTERQFGGGFDHLNTNFLKNAHSIPNARCFPLDWADSEQLSEVRKFLETSEHPVVLIGSELVYNPITCSLLSSIISDLLLLSPRLKHTPTFFYAHSLNRFAMIDVDLFARLGDSGLTVQPLKRPDRSLDVASLVGDSALFEDLEIEIFKIFVSTQHSASRTLA